MSCALRHSSEAMPRFTLQNITTGIRHFAPVVRIHALYDRVRSFPGAESTPTSDVDLIKRYDPGR